MSINNGECSSSAWCDFESGFCGYYNTKEDDDLDWMIGRAHHPASYQLGPAITSDHTTGTPQGHLVYLNQGPIGDKVVTQKGNLLKN